MGQTTVEKIISKHSGRSVSQGDYVYVDVDRIMIPEGTCPLTMRAFENMGGGRLYCSDKFVIVFDHGIPSPSRQVANLQQLVRNFVKDQGCWSFDAGEGICHQLMIEKGFVHSGDLVVGNDSHSCSYGAVGAFGTGMGSTDVAYIMKTGKTWMRVPPSIRVDFYNKLAKNAMAKDVILEWIGTVTGNGATYASIEFYDHDQAFDLNSRTTICNMVVETGAKGGIFPEGAFIADENAVYAKKYTIDVSKTVPMLSCPHQVDNVCSVKQKEGIQIHQVLIGSCTNGRLSDLACAAEILKGHHTASGVRLLVVPASREILLRAAKYGIIEQLVAAGCILLPPGCGPCAGTLGGIPGDGDVVLSTSNRNFLGRMGNKCAEIYLCSPLTAAVSALTGVITNP